MYVEILMGHKALGVTGAYFKPSPNDLLEGNDKMLGYLNVMDSLTINDENRLRLQVEKLSSKNNDSQQIITEKLEEKDKQIEQLMVKQDKFEQLVQSLITAGQLAPDTSCKSVSS